jgi:hypothetical protein
VLSRRNCRRWSKGSMRSLTRRAPVHPTQREERMFDHVKFAVSDYSAGKTFFLKALAPLGVEAGAEGEPSCGIELCEGSMRRCGFIRPGRILHLCISSGRRSPPW